MLLRNPKAPTAVPVYFIAVFSVFIIAFLRVNFPFSLVHDTPMIFFLFAPLVTTLIGGLWPGLFATLLAMIVGRYMFVSPTWDLGITDAREAYHATLFVLQGVVTSLLCGALRKSHEKLRVSLNQLRLNEDVQRGAAQAIVEAKNAAEAANRAKTNFLATMSHEIRTPLGVILGFTELLTYPGYPKECVEKATIIKKNAEQLCKIVNEVLDVSKIEAGRVEIEQIAFSLSDFLTDISTAMNFKAREKNLDFRIISSGPLPQRIKSDPTRLRQILINLIDNALKFTERGHVEVTVRSVEQSSQKVQLEFLIEDTGIGLNDDQKSRIFKAFEQGDESVTRRFGGTGLGLYLSKRLANLLGGNLELVASEINKGTTFHLFINCEMGTASEYDHAKAKTPSSPSHLENVSILVADDMPDLRILICNILQSVGAQVTTANDGMQAVGLAAKEPFDVILMDVQMPVLNGLETTERLRKLGYRKPIIALTASAMAKDRERCLRAGCDDYLSKPFTPKELIEKVVQTCAPTLAFQRPHTNQGSAFLH